MRSVKSARRGLVLLLLIAAPLSIWANDENPSSVVLATPDFSEEALARILETQAVELDVYEDRLEMRWADWVVRFLPIVMPLTLNDGSHGSAQIHEPVSGLALLGVDYPMAGPAGDEMPPEELSWGERRFRRRMIHQVNRANARDNR